MKAVILAAGASKRLRPLTDSVPKCLLEVEGGTILERMIGILQAHGISDCVIVTGYCAGQVQDAVRVVFPDLRVEFIRNEEFAATENAFSLWLARDRVRGQEILLLDGDIVFDGRIIDLLVQPGYESCCAVVSGKPLGREEIKVRMDDRSAVVEIGKDVSPSAAHGESIGIEKLGPAFCARLFGVLDRMILAEKNVDRFYESAFQEVIDAGGIMIAVDVGELPCMEIDTPEDLEAARAMIRLADP